MYSAGTRYTELKRLRRTLSGKMLAGRSRIVRLNRLASKELEKQMGSRRVAIYSFANAKIRSAIVTLFTCGRLIGQRVNLGTRGRGLMVGG